MLTTIDNVKEQLGIDEEDTSQDDMIERHIKTVTAAVEAYLKRKLELQEHTERIAPVNSDIIVPKQWPIKEVVEVEYGDEILDEEEYEVFEDKVIKKDGKWDKYEVQITYEAGYIMPGEEGRDLPYDLENAAIYHAMHTYHSFDRLGVKEEQVDRLRVRYAEPEKVGERPAPLPGPVMAMLDPHRRISL